MHMAAETKLFTIACVIFFLGVSHGLDVSSLFYTYNGHGVNVLVSNSHLLTLPADAATADLLAGLPAGCALVLRSGVTSLPEAPLLASLGAAARLKCPDGVRAVQQWAEPSSLEPFRVASRQEEAVLRARKQAEEKEYPFESIEILGNTLEADIRWALDFIANHWGKLADFPSYSGQPNDTGVFHLNSGQQYSGDRNHKFPGGDDGEVRVAIASDWGAGTREADYVARLMVKDFDPHYTLHLGDIYTVSTVDQVKSNTMGIAPAGVRRGVKLPYGSLGTFALNGNHEMYARGIGYFEYLLPTLGARDNRTGLNLGQKASFTALLNHYWRLVCLDTGYNSYSVLLHNDDNTQPPPVIAWLKDVVRLDDPADTRPIIFFSHHQYFSAWEKGYLATPKQLAALVPPGRKTLWIWGHEHRLSFYDITNSGGVALDCYARCVGVGGFPPVVNMVPPNPRATKLQAYDNRLYEISDGIFKIPVGFNGFTRLTFKGPMLNITYHSLVADAQGDVSPTESELLVWETFKADLAGGHVVATDFQIVNKNMTVVTHLERTRPVLATE